MTEDNMSSFISLEAELEDWFETPLDELSEDLQKRVERGFRPTPWDNLTPDDRRRRACLWDGWENPAFEKERRRLWDDFIVPMCQLEEKIEETEATQNPTATDLDARDKRIEGFESELRKVTEEFEREAGSSVSLPDGTPEQQEGRQSSKQDDLLVPKGGDRLTEKLYNFANEVGIAAINAPTFPKSFRAWLAKNHSDFTVEHGSITYLQGNEKWADVNDTRLKARIYRLRLRFRRPRRAK